MPTHTERDAAMPTIVLSLAWIRTWPHITTAGRTAPSLARGVAFANSSGSVGSRSFLRFYHCVEKKNDGVVSIISAFRPSCVSSLRASIMVLEVFFVGMTL